MRLVLFLCSCNSAFEQVNLDLRHFRNAFIIIIHTQLEYELHTTQERGGALLEEKHRYEDQVASLQNAQMTLQSHIQQLQVICSVPPTFSHHPGCCMNLFMYGRVVCYGCLQLLVCVLCHCTESQVRFIFTAECLKTSDVWLCHFIWDQFSNQLLNLT